MLQNLDLLRSLGMFSWLLCRDSPGKQEKKKLYLKVVSPSLVGFTGTSLQCAFACVFHALPKEDGEGRL